MLIKGYGPAGLEVDHTKPAGLRYHRRVRTEPDGEWKMNKREREYLVGNLVGLRACLGALARELLLQHGTDAFLHAEMLAQGNLTDMPWREDVTEELRRHAMQVVDVVFSNAKSPWP